MTDDSRIFTTTARILFYNMWIFTTTPRILFYNIFYSTTSWFEPFGHVIGSRNTSKDR